MIEIESIDLLNELLKIDTKITIIGNNTKASDGSQVDALMRRMLPAYDSDRTVVLGMDLYKYSKMEPYRQSLIPFLLDALRLATLADLIKGCPFVFQNWSVDSTKTLRDRMVNSGDGCYVIFENHIEALCFLIMFQSKVHLFNSHKLLPELRSYVGDVNIRFAITFDSIYKFNKNYYGNGIIKNARIMAKDKLNRVLIDKNTYDWYLERLSGIENIVNFSVTELEQVPELRQLNKVSNPDTFIFVDRDEFPREGIKTVLCSKLENIKEKEDEFAVFNLYLQINMGIIYESKTHYFNYSIGNNNVNGI